MEKRSRADNYEPTSEEREELARVGLVRIPMEIPFRVAPVNVLVVLGEKIALIDGAIRYMNNIQRLEDGLARVGLGLHDIEEIWLTHPHIDHFGLCGEIVQRSGAKVIAWEGSVHRFEQYSTWWEQEHASFLEMLLLSEVKEEQILQVQNSPNTFDEMASPVHIDQTFGLDAPVLIAGSTRAQPLHVPGHSPWCTAFWLEEQRVLLGGDVLLERSTPNPILYPATSAPAQWQGLPVYGRSLMRLHELPCDFIIPGHGALFRRHRPIIERVLRQLESRKHRIFELLQEAGPLTAYQVALRCFGEEITHASLFLVMGSTIRQLDWLLAEHKISMRQDTALRYQTAKYRD